MKKGQWQRKHEKMVKQLIGDYPVIDAKVAFRNIVLPVDIKGSKQKDPAHCALARSIGRQTGMKDGIAVFHHVAYAPFDKRGNGKITIERFYLDGDTKRAVEKFDRTGVFPPGEYVFLPPSKSQRLEAVRKYQRAYHKKTKRTHRRTNWTGKPRVSMLGVRNGTGAVKVCE